VDLYCGIGTRGRPLARKAALTVWGIESRVSVACALENAELNGSLTRVLSRETFGQFCRRSAGARARPTSWVVDRPRAGPSGTALRLLGTIVAPAHRLSCRETDDSCGDLKVLRESLLLRLLLAFTCRHFPAHAEFEPVSLLRRIRRSELGSPGQKRDTRAACRTTIPSGFAPGSGHCDSSTWRNPKSQYSVRCNLHVQVGPARSVHAWQRSGVAARPAPAIGPAS